eukprot:94509-Alexandrium_andersonii.AAC.1
MSWMALRLRASRGVSSAGLHARTTLRPALLSEIRWVASIGVGRCGRRRPHRTGPAQSRRDVGVRDAGPH